MLERLLAPSEVELALLNALLDHPHVVAPGAPPWRPLTQVELGRVDFEAVADEITDEFADAEYPALVLGAPHGAAVHLAALLGAPWLPSELVIAAGAGVGWRRAPRPWNRLPLSYKIMMQHRLAANAPVIVVRNAATTPAFTTEAVRFARWCGRAPVQVVYTEPSVLSQLVADTLRQMLRSGERPDDWLAVQLGRRIDVAVVREGAVAYWCPDHTSAHYRAAEWWTAASEPFAHIEVAVDREEVDTLAGWLSVCRFATRIGTVDLLNRPPRGPGPPVLPADPHQVVYELCALADRSGVLIV
jgi:hypothetical protein